MAESTSRPTRQKILLLSLVPPMLILTAIWLHFLLGVFNEDPIGEPVDLTWMTWVLDDWEDTGVAWFIGLGGTLPVIYVYIRWIFQRKDPEPVFDCTDPECPCVRHVVERQNAEAEAQLRQLQDNTQFSTYPMSASAQKSIQNMQKLQ
jgi:hypothetical protein